MVRILLVLAVFLSSSHLVNAQKKIGQKKKTVYEEVDLENVMKRYFGKSFGYSIEGIYSVSCVITKRNKRLLSKSERIRVVARQDNYAKVAIMKSLKNRGSSYYLRLFNPLFKQLKRNFWP